jgi:hypothetical protein
MTVRRETHRLVDGALPVPDNLDDGNNQWIEEAIYGHRFYNDQTPWFAYLEFLHVCEHRCRDRNHQSLFVGRTEHRHEVFDYALPAREELRRLLFLDERLDELANNPMIDERQALKEWLEALAAEDGRDADSYAYLGQRFGSLHDMYRAVELVRGAEIDQHRSRRYTSRHLVPFGPAALTADFRRQANGSPSFDRRFFARGGELVYLMLGRSRVRERLEKLIEQRLLAEDSRWNRLIAALQPAETRRPTSLLKGGYLPLPHHPRYDRLAEDMVQLLELEGLDSENLHEPLVRMIGLNVLLYLHERSVKVLDEPLSPLVLDLAGADASALKSVARSQYSQNRELSTRAIRRHVERVRDLDEWRDVVRRPDHTARRAFFERYLGFKPEVKKSSRYSRETDANAMLEEICELALANHEQHLAQVPGVFAGAIGLATARRGFGRAYGASDALLEALVLSQVTAPMAFDQFLALLYERFHIVIGYTEARQAFSTPNAPQEQFKINQRRLEERLRSLGLLRRLSDDCAFVFNPFSKPGRSA